MAANPINQLASVAGLAFPPGTVNPDPTLGTGVLGAEELEQVGYSFAFDFAVSAATTIAVFAGNNQSATVGTAVAIAPAVLVTDGTGTGIAGVAVTFAVVSGDGTITGAAAVSDAHGVATLGSWTLGSVDGVNTLSATAAGLAGSPLTFTATGTAVPARPDSYIWQIPRGSKNAYGKGASVLPVLQSRGRLVQTGVEHYAMGVSRLPALRSLGIGSVLDAPEAVGMLGASVMPTLVSWGQGVAGSEDDEILTMLAAYLVQR